MEKVNQAFLDQKEVKFFVPSLVPNALYKDLWVVKSALKWGSKVRFKKKEDGIEIFVRAAEVAIAEIQETVSAKEVVAKAAAKAAEKSIEWTEITGTPSLTEIATLLVQLHGNGTKYIKVSLSHLSVAERMKLEKVFAHLSYLASDVKNWTQLKLKETENG